MVDLVIGTELSEKIRHRLSELATGVRTSHVGHAEAYNLSYDDRLTDVCLDSLWLQDFLMVIEDEYDITLGMHETAELSTVSDLVELIESKIK